MVSSVNTIFSWTQEKRRAFATDAHLEKEVADRTRKDYIAVFSRSSLHDPIHRIGPHLL